MPEQREAHIVYDREPEVGDDVHLKGRGPAWHKQFYLRNDNYRWEEVRPNATIMAIVEDDDEEDVAELWLDGYGLESVPLRKFKKYIKPPAENHHGCWFVVV